MSDRMKLLSLLVVASVSCGTLLGTIFGYFLPSLVCIVFFILWIVGNRQMGLPTFYNCKL